MVLNSTVAPGKWSGSDSFEGLLNSTVAPGMWFKTALLIMGGGAVPICCGVEQYCCLWELERFPFVVGNCYSTVAPARWSGAHF